MMRVHAFVVFCLYHQLPMVLFCDWVVAVASERRTVSSLSGSDDSAYVLEL